MLFITNGDVETHNNIFKHFEIKVVKISCQNVPESSL